MRPGGHKEGERGEPSPSTSGFSAKERLIVLPLLMLEGRSREEAIDIIANQRKKNKQERLAKKPQQ